MSELSYRDCPCCLEPEPFCVCEPLYLEGADIPGKVKICWRSLTHPSVRFWGAAALDYRKAVEECQALNTLYAGKVEHFLVPANFRSLRETPAHPAARTGTEGTSPEASS